MLSKREEKLVLEERVARLATLSEEGRIHVVPVCYTYDGKSIFIGTSLNSKKVKNLRRNSNAALIIDRYVEDWSKLKGVMIQGRATIVEAGREFEEARRLLYKKYPQYEEQAPIKEGESAVIKVIPEKTFAWDYEE